MLRSTKNALKFVNPLDITDRGLHTDVEVWEASRNLCGQVKYDFCDLAVMTDAYEKLIKALSRLKDDTFNLDQWIRLFRGIVSDSDKPLQTQDDGSFKLAIDSDLGDVNRDRNSPQYLLRQKNKLSLLKHAVIKKIISICWKEGLLNACYATVFMEQDRLKEIEASEAIQFANSVDQLLSLGWQGCLFDNELSLQIAATSLILISRVSFDSSAKGSIRHCVSVYEKALWLCSECEKFYEKNIRKLLTAVTRVLDIAMGSDKLVYAASLFLGTVLIIPIHDREILNNSHGIMWKAMKSLIESAQMELNRDDIGDGKTVTIDSPEVDNDEWVDNLCSVVPAELDKNEKNKQEMKVLILLIKKQVSLLLKNMPKCEEKIESDMILAVFELLAKYDVGKLVMDAEVGFEASYATAAQNGAIPVDVQHKLVKQTLEYGGSSSGDVLVVLVRNGLPCERENLALDVYESFAAKLRLGCILTEDELQLCRTIRPVCHKGTGKVIETLLTTFITMQPLSMTQVDQGEIQEQIVTILHIILLGGRYLPSQLSDRNFSGSSEACLSDVGLPAICELGLKSDLFSRGLRCVAHWWLSHSFYYCPPFVYPIVTENEFDEKIDSDFAILSYVFRLMPFYRSAEGEKATKELYANQPRLLDLVAKFYSDERLESNFIKVLKAYKATADVFCGSEASRNLILLDCFHIAFSFGLKLNVKTLETIRSVLSTISLRNLRDICIRWDCRSSFDRLCSIYSVYRNPILVEALGFNKLADTILDDLIKIKADEQKTPSIFPVYPTDKFKPTHELYDLISDKKSDIVAERVVDCLRTELASYVLKRKKSHPFDEPDASAECAKLCVDIASMAYWSNADAIEAADFLRNLLSSPEEFFLFNHTFIINYIVSAATNVQTQSPIEKYSLSTFFAETMAELLSSEHYRNVNWTDDMLETTFTILRTTLVQCAEEASPTTAITPPFAAALSSILQSKKVHSGPRNHIAKMIAELLPLLPKWLSFSQCPAAVLLEFSPLISVLSEEELVSSENIAHIIGQCVISVVTPQVADQLFEQYPISIQSSHRFSQNALKFVGSHSVRSPFNNALGTPVLEENSLIYISVLQVFCRFGDKHTYIKILSLAPSVISSLIICSQAEEQVIRGNAVLTPAENRVVFRLMVANALMLFVSETASQVRGQNLELDDSESEAMKLKICEAFNAIEMTSKKADLLSKSPRLCTYAATEKHFVNQHWYNCYTCDMCGQVGVCSVCAVNCHRGHDIAYSKLGSFFCDCGANQCESLKSTKYESFSENAVRGQTILPDQKLQSVLPVEEKPTFELKTELNITSANILPSIKALADVFSEKESQIDEVIQTCIASHELLWTANKKKEEARNSLLDISNVKLEEGTIFDSSTAVTINSMFASPSNRRQHQDSQIERTSTKSVNGIVELDGRNLWLYGDGCSLNILHLEPGTLFTDDLSRCRQEVEAVNFTVRSVSCLGDRGAVMGRSQVLFLRFGPDGEIIYRNSLTFGEMSVHTNPTTKVEWAPNRTAMAAVATLQFVRIYDFMVSVENPVEEVQPPDGNVDDIRMIGSASDLFLLVLSSSGTLYTHKVSMSSQVRQSSLFLMNRIEVPQSSGNPVSMYYSPVSEILFCSFDSGTFYTSIPSNSFSADEIKPDWKKLSKIDQPLHCWQEMNGIIGALPYNQCSYAAYIYPSTGQLLVQKLDHHKRIPCSHLLLTNSQNGLLYAALMYTDSPAIVIYSAKWDSIPDLWLESLPMELIRQDIPEIEDPSTDVVPEDLVTMLESCDLIEKIEVQCQPLARLYDPLDLSQRLYKIGEQSVTVTQADSFDVSFRILDANMIVRCIRIEVPGAKGPAEVTIGPIRQPLLSSSSRFYDIHLSRNHSIEIDAKKTPLVLHFNSVRSLGTSTITSIRLFGVKRRDFGFRAPLAVASLPQSLPDQHLLNIILLLRTFKTFDVAPQDNSWFLSIARQVMRLRTSHRSVYNAGCDLLKAIHPNNSAFYYGTKVEAFIDEMKNLVGDNIKIPPMLQSDLAQDLKIILCTRLKIFLKGIRTELGGSVAFISYLADQLSVSAKDLSLLKVFAAISLILIAVKDENTEEIIRIFLNLIVKTETRHLSHPLIATTQYFLFGHSSKGEAITSTENESSLVFLDMLKPVLYYGEEANLDSDIVYEVVIAFANSVVSRLVDEDWQQGASDERKGTVRPPPSASILTFAVVLLTRLYPRHLSTMLPKLTSLLESSSESSAMREFMVLRLVYMVLSQCHIVHNKAVEAAGTATFNDDSKMTEGEPADRVDSEDGEEDDDEAPVTPTIESQSVRLTKQDYSTSLEEFAKHLDNVGILKYCLSCIQRCSAIVKLYTENSMTFDGSKAAEAIVDHPEQAEFFYVIFIDVCLKLAIRIKKICSDVKFDSEWVETCCSICEFELGPIPEFASIRNHSRRLLIALCDGNKTRYRYMRDQHVMNSLVHALMGAYSSPVDDHIYEHMAAMVEYVNRLRTAANNQPEMWGLVCEKNLNWLLTFSHTTPDPASGNMIDLIISAIRHENHQAGSRAEVIHLADKLIEDKDNLLLFKLLMFRFLIGKDIDRRWLLHGMIRSTIQLASRQNQITLLRVLLNDMWPLAANLGVQGAQLTDLLGFYLPRLFSTSELLAVCDAQLNTIKEVAKCFIKEGNDTAYDMMMGLGLGWNFMVMVSNPCMTCFPNKKVPEVLKLNTIKSDARFSSSAIMVKLVGYYEVSRVIVKFSEVKKTKTVKTVKVYYCPKAVESPVELKTSRDLWRHTGSTSATTSDGEMIVSLAIPVVTSSLVIEFAELIDNKQNNELHCPRCSSVVQQSAGVCDNCGENALQCVKCRGINYDDKDPFLCQSCGHCKYARIDVALLGRALPGVQPITSDTERSLAVENMSLLVFDMEQTRCQLNAGRALCEALWLSSRPLPSVDIRTETKAGCDMVVSNTPNYTVKEHPADAVKDAYRYCFRSHEELCNQTHRLIAYREELRTYDHGNENNESLLHSSINPGYYNANTSCFACQCFRIVHSLYILQGVCENSQVADRIIGDEEICKQLIRSCYKYRTLKVELENLFCRLAFENERGTKRLCELVTDGFIDNSVLSKSVLTLHDSLWQTKLKTLLKLAMHSRNEELLISTLQLLEQLTSDAKSTRVHAYEFVTNKGAAENSADMRRQVRVGNDRIASCNVSEWMKGSESWSEHKISFSVADVGKMVNNHEWLWQCMFSTWASVRAAASRLLISIMHQPGMQGITALFIVRGLRLALKCSPSQTDQFFVVAHRFISRPVNKSRMFLAGIHLWLIHVIKMECQQLYDHEKQETSMDHSLGFILRNFVDLLTILFTGGSLETALLKAASDHVLIPVLKSTINLKRVVLHRTRSVDAARVGLERLLKRVIARDPFTILEAAIKALEEDPDFFTQAQIISVIVDILAPEQHQEESFLLQIDKDPAQEDFLQGRMTGNPYKSTDAGMGPLMRDIKNRICRDTEMVALLEDDNGMELLVNGQIISLSLPVSAVYEKLWRRSNSGPMSIIYRMRGLMGDAVEPFVSTLGDGEGEDEGDDSSLKSLVDAFMRHGGIEKALALIGRCNVTTGGRFVLSQMKRLLDCIIKSDDGRKNLVKNGAIRTLMDILQHCVRGRMADDGIVTIGSDYLHIMGQLVSDINTHPYLGHLKKDDATWLLELALRRPSACGNKPLSDCRRSHTQLMTDVVLLLGNLLLGNLDSEQVLIDQCRETFNWCAIDTMSDVARRAETVQDAGRLCEVIAGILPSDLGNKLKNGILASGVMSEACEYLLATHPLIYSATETPEWKLFLGKPSLRLILTFMHSMTKAHKDSQEMLSERTLPLLHRLEQVASDNSIGTLAENVMEALKENDEVARKIETVRLETKQKKRQMAMAMRSKQLSKMGMHMGKGGEVKVAARKIANEPVLEDTHDPLSSCCICRDPVLLSSEKAAAAYAFVFTAVVNEVYLMSSVSQMVLVHVDCHSSAIRRGGGGRNADEWTKASLHNAGAQCNILTPLAVGSCSSPSWQHAINKYQSDLNVVGMTSPISRTFVVADMCQLIDRFVTFGSFSELSHGGGRESNAQYLAVLHLLACHLPEGEELVTAQTHWRVYMFLITEQSLSAWNDQRIEVLRAALNAVDIPEGAEPWTALKTTSLAWAFVDLYFRNVIPIESPDRSEWLQQHILETFKRTPSFVAHFDKEIATCNAASELWAKMDVINDEILQFFL